MSLKTIHDKQPENFVFSDTNIKLAENILKKYPEKNKKSAVMPFLYLAQKFQQFWHLAKEKYCVYALYPSFRSQLCHNLTLQIFHINF